MYVIKKNVYWHQNISSISFGMFDYGYDGHPLIFDSHGFFTFLQTTVVRCSSHEHRQPVTRKECP